MRAASLATSMAIMVVVGLVSAARLVRIGERRRAVTASRRRLVPGGAPLPRWVSAAQGRLVRSARGAPPVVAWRARTERAERERLLPDFVEAVARSLSAGSSLGRALQDAGEVVGEPFASDVARVGRRLDGGVGLVDALHRWAGEAGGEDLRLFVTACTLGADVGRGTSSALGGVAATLADRRDVMGEARALSAQARASAVLLAALPVVFAIGTAAVDPATTRELLTTPLGGLCLAGGLGLDVAGALWMRRLVGSVA